MKTFKLSPVLIFFIHLSFWVFMIGTVVADVYLVVTAHADAPPWSVVLLVAIVSLIFGGIALGCWLTIRKMPWMDLGADPDGIWTLYEGKEEGLVPWDRIANIRERLWMQCLDLEDASGNRLIRVVYQLKDFKLLRKMILKQFRETQPMGESSPKCFAKGRYYHFENILGLCFMVCLSAGFFAIDETGLAVVCGALTLLGIYDYMTTVSGLSISDQLCLNYPLRRRYLPFSAVSAIEMTDLFHRGYRIPGVRLTFRSGRPVRLVKLGSDAAKLHTALHRAVEAPAVSGGDGVNSLATGP